MSRRKTKPIPPRTKEQELAFRRRLLPFLKANPGIAKAIANGWAEHLKQEHAAKEEAQ